MLKKIFCALVALAVHSPQLAYAQPGSATPPGQGAKPASVAPSQPQSICCNNFQAYVDQLKAELEARSASGQCKLSSADVRQIVEGFVADIRAKWSEVGVQSAHCTHPGGADIDFGDNTPPLPRITGCILVRPAIAALLRAHERARRMCQPPPVPPPPPTCTLECKCCTSPTCCRQSPEGRLDIFVHLEQSVMLQVVRTPQVEAEQATHSSGFRVLRPGLNQVVGASVPLVFSSGGVGVGAGVTVAPWRMLALQEMQRADLGALDTLPDSGAGAYLVSGARARLHRQVAVLVVRKIAAAIDAHGGVRAGSQLLLSAAELQDAISEGVDEAAQFINNSSGPARMPVLVARKVVSAIDARGGVRTGSQLLLSAAELQGAISEVDAANQLTKNSSGPPREASHQNDASSKKPVGKSGFSDLSDAIDRAWPDVPAVAPVADALLRQAIEEELTRAGVRATSDVMTKALVALYQSHASAGRSFMDAMAEAHEEIRTQLYSRKRPASRVPHVSGFRGELLRLRVSAAGMDRPGASERAAGVVQRFGAGVSWEYSREDPLQNGKVATCVAKAVAGLKEDSSAAGDPTVERGDRAGRERGLATAVRSCGSEPNGALDGFGVGLITGFNADQADVPHLDLLSGWLAAEVRDDRWAATAMLAGGRRLVPSPADGTRGRFDGQLGTRGTLGGEHGWISAEVAYGSALFRSTDANPGAGLLRLAWGPAAGVGVAAYLPVNLSLATTGHVRCTSDRCESQLVTSIGWTQPDPFVSELARRFGLQTRN